MVSNTTLIRLVVCHPMMMEGNDEILTCAIYELLHVTRSYKMGTKIKHENRMCLVIKDEQKNKLNVELG